MVSRLPMPGFVSVPVTVPSGELAGGAIARIGFDRQLVGQEALEDDQVEQLGPGCPGPYLPGVTP